VSEAKLLTTGSGRIGYRLVIEGWPDMFVTGPEITASTVADGRTIIPCLQYEGLRMADRIRPMDGKIEADGMTFRLAPPGGTWSASGGTDPLTASFARFPSPIATLLASLEEDTTSAEIRGAALQDGQHYWIGTETIVADPVEGTTYDIERAVWDSIAQSHHTTVIDRSRTVYIYDYPPTMEGRRAYLYRYVDGYQLTGAGTAIWRGIVSRPPRRSSSDGVTWLIDALPITHLLRQKLAGGIGEARPVGIYHHAKACFAFRLSINTGTGFKPTTIGDIRKYCGFDSKETLISGINALLEEERVAIGADTYFDSITLSQQGSFWAIHFHRNSTAGTVSIGFEGGSYLLGYAMSAANARPFSVIGGSTSGGPWLWNVPQQEALPELDATYQLLLSWDPEYTTDGVFGREWGGEPASPLGNAVATFTVTSSLTGAQFEDLSQTTNFPPFRVYLDTELVDVDAVTINCPYGSDLRWAITATGTASLTASGVTADVFFIELEPRVIAHPPSLRAQLFGGGDSGLSAELRGPTFGFFGVLDANAVIKRSRLPVYGSIADFAVSVTDNAVHANDGDVPFVTTHDLNLGQWVLSDQIVSDTLLHRIYDFAKPITLEDVFAEDLKLAGHMPRLTEDGKIGIVPMAQVTDAAPIDAAHTIDGSKMILPTGNYGSWPQVEPQADGIATQLSIQEYYDAGLDDWVDKPFVITDDDAVATHKGRGKVDIEIKAYSRPESPSVADVGAAGVSAITFLGFLSRDYIVVTIEVPFTCWPVLCGDVVQLTSRYVPDGTGGTGVTARNCIVVGREWNLDPSLPMMGKLTLWMHSQGVLGYAPAASITSQANDSGNTWTLTCDPSDDFNEQISTNGDGKCLLHFHDADFIRIVEWDTDTPTIVTGVVVGTPDATAGTMVVSLDSTWTPGSSLWLVEAQEDDGSAATTAQRKYQYEADADQIKPDGRFAGQFA
jgi:hypothetical protein